MLFIPSWPQKAGKSLLLFSIKKCHPFGVNLQNKQLLSLNNVIPATAGRLFGIEKPERLE
jgi:hypothetical protein